MDSEFTKPEVEAALLLIQLSSDFSDYDHVQSSLKSGNDEDEDFHVLIKDLHKKKRGLKESMCMQQGSGCGSGTGTNNSNSNSNYSDVTSAMSGTTATTVKKLPGKEENDDEDIACGPRQKIKRFRLLDELYRLTN